MSWFQSSNLFIAPEMARSMGTLLRCVTDTSGGCKRWDDDWSIHLELNLAQNGVAKNVPPLGLQQLFDVRSCDKRDFMT